MIHKIQMEISSKPKVDPLHVTAKILRKFEQRSSRFRERALTRAWAFVAEPVSKIIPTIQSLKMQTMQRMALRRMRSGRWNEAHELWRCPTGSTVSGEKLQLWNAGRAITNWVIHPRTLPQVGSEPHISSQQTIVFSAITGSHDLSWPAGQPLPSARYIRLTDDPYLPTWNIWQNVLLNDLALSPIRSARWVKTHPHVLFPDCRWAIWLDGNVIALRSLHSYFTEFQASGHPMAAIPHPLRTRVGEEVRECARRGKDKPTTLRQHHARLGEEPNVGLWETNVLFFDLHHPDLKPLLTDWWAHVDSGSHRDQISLPYAVKSNEATIHPLLPNGHSTRSDPSFALIPHKDNAFESAHRYLLSLSLDIPINTGLVDKLRTGR